MRSGKCCCTAARAKVIEEVDHERLVGRARLTQSHRSLAASDNRLCRAHGILCRATLHCLFRCHTLGSCLLAFPERIDLIVDAGIPNTSEIEIDDKPFSLHRRICSTIASECRALGWPSPIRRPASFTDRFIPKSPTNHLTRPLGWPPRRTRSLRIVRTFCKSKCAKSYGGRRFRLVEKSCAEVV